MDDDDDDARFLRGQFQWGRISVRSTSNAIPPHWFRPFVSWTYKIILLCDSTAFRASSCFALANFFALARIASPPPGGGGYLPKFYVLFAWPRRSAIHFNSFWYVSLQVITFAVRPRKRAIPVLVLRVLRVSVFYAFSGHLLLLPHTLITFTWHCWLVLPRKYSLYSKVKLGHQSGLHHSMLSSKSYRSIN